MLSWRNEMQFCIVVIGDLNARYTTNRRLNVEVTANDILMKKKCLYSSSQIVRFYL